MVKSALNHLNIFILCSSDHILFILHVLLLCTMLLLFCIRYILLIPDLYSEFELIIQGSSPWRYIKGTSNWICQKLNLSFTLLFFFPLMFPIWVNGITVPIETNCKKPGIIPKILPSPQPPLQLHCYNFASDSHYMPGLPFSRASHCQQIFLV